MHSVPPCKPICIVQVTETSYYPSIEKREGDKIEWACPIPKNNAREKMVVRSRPRLVYALSTVPLLRTSNDKGKEKATIKE